MNKQDIIDNCRKMLDIFNEWHYATLYFSAPDDVDDKKLERLQRASDEFHRALDEAICDLED